jgi:DNA-binding transcriptional ArsR family regulator
MTLSRRRVASAQGLRALAHPVRLELLDLLAAAGPKTASQAGVVIGQSASNCSWHLRKLAQHGFVREVRGATGRERPWQLVTEGLTWADDETAAEGVNDVILERDVQRLRAARAAGAAEPHDWREATGVEQRQLWLTAEEAGRLRADLVTLLNLYGGRSEGSRRVSAVAWIVPTAPFP